MELRKELFQIHELLGIALADSQQLEHSLAILMLLLNKPIDSPENEISEFMNNLSKKTLGQLINRLGKEIELAEEFRKKMLDALEARNFITHKFFRDQNENLLTINGRKLALAKLEKERLLLKNGVEYLDPIIINLMNKKGIDSARLAEEEWSKIEREE